MTKLVESDEQPILNERKNDVENGERDWETQRRGRRILFFPNQRKFTFQQRISFEYFWGENENWSAQDEVFESEQCRHPLHLETILVPIWLDVRAVVVAAAAATLVPVFVGRRIDELRQSVKRFVRHVFTFAFEIGRGKVLDDDDANVVNEN